MSNFWAILKTSSKKYFYDFDLQVLPKENKDLIYYGPEGLENLLSHYGSNKTNLCKNELTCPSADLNPITLPNMRIKLLGT